MDTPRWEQKLGSYGKALKRLKEIVVLSHRRDLTEIEKDGLIQRFEFTHELAWKLMMSFCKYQSPEIELFGSVDVYYKSFVEFYNKMTTLASKSVPELFDTE